MKITTAHERAATIKMNRFSGICLVLLSFVVPSCSEKKDSTQKVTEGKIVIKGSNTIGEELAPRLIAEYKKDHPKVLIDLETKGSGSGFWGLIAGVCDIAAASRSMIKDKQQQAQVRNIELNEAVIGS